MKFEIPDEDKKLILAEIKNHLGSTQNPKVYIYGSRVKGNARKYSDIDLLLKAEHYDLDALEKIDFQQLDTVYKVDFVMDENLFEGYRQEIESHMVLFE